MLYTVRYTNYVAVEQRELVVTRFSPLRRGPVGQTDPRSADNQCSGFMKMTTPSPCSRRANSR
jgi:hypothetical protein